jgi:hypothetical protein
MGELSQRTVALMTRIFEALCIPPDSDTLPIVSKSDLSLELYELGFEKDLLDYLEKDRAWDFRDVMPDIFDGQFMAALRHHAQVASRSLRGIVWVPPGGFKQPARQPDDAENGRQLLLRLAEYLCLRIDALRTDLPEVKVWRENLLASLTLDGFSLVGGKFVPSDSAVIDQAGETTLLREQIKKASFPRESLILGHYEQAEELFVDRKWHPAIGEWRSFFQAVIQDIAEITGHNRSDVKKSDGTMKDDLRFLLQTRFFSEDEWTIVGAVWGFLSAGSHPGISLPHQARIAMIQALCFGQVLSSKYLVWRDNSFKGYQT